MANNTLILGNLASSGSAVINNSLLFSTFGNSANFEVPDFITSASGEISLVDNNFIFNNPISSSALTISNIHLETTESSITAGNTTLGEFPTASYKSLYIDYLIQSDSSKSRAGQLISTWKGANVTFTDTSAKSIGDTSDAEFSVVLNGVNADLKISSSNSYDVTIASRGILNGSSFALGGGNISTSPFPFTGSALITGSLDITGSIIPGGDALYDLGDSTHFWRTASIEHIVTLGDTIEFRDKDNKNTRRGTLKLDAQGNLDIKGGNGTLSAISASSGFFTGNLQINGIPNVSASIADAASSGGGGGGGVSSIIAGNNATVSPSEGTGDVTIGLTPQSSSFKSSGLFVIDTTINYNVTTAITVQFGQAEYNQGDSITPSSGSNSALTVSEAGYYQVDALVAFNTGGARTTPGMNVYIDGVEVEGRAYGYIRNASGATEASCTISRVIYLPNGTEEVTIKVANFGASGTCNAQQGYFQLTKIDNSALQGPEGPNGPTGQPGTSFSVSLETVGKTLSLSDNLSYIKCSPSSPGATYTVPPQSSVSWPDSCEIAFEQGNAFPITIAAGTGVTVNSSATLVSSGENAVMALKRVDTNIWTLTGERSTS